MQPVLRGGVTAAAAGGRSLAWPCAQCVGVLRGGRDGRARRGTGCGAEHACAAAQGGAPRRTG